MQVEYIMKANSLFHTTISREGLQAVDAKAETDSKSLDDPRNF